MNLEEYFELARSARLTSVDRQHLCMFPTMAPNILSCLYEHVIWKDLPALPDAARLRVTTMDMSTMTLERILNLDSKNEPGQLLLDVYVNAVTNAQYGLDVQGAIFSEYTRYVNSKGKPVITYNQAKAILEGELPDMVTEEWREDMRIMLEPVRLVRQQEEELYNIAVETRHCTDELEENRAIFLRHMAYENMLSYIWM